MIQELIGEHADKAFVKKVREMKIFCVCGHMISSKNDLLMHALVHAASDGFIRTAEEKARLTV